MKITQDSAAGINQILNTYWRNCCPKKIDRFFKEIEKIDSGDIKLRILGVDEAVKRHRHYGVFKNRTCTEVYDVFSYEFVKGGKKTPEYICTDDAPEAFLDEIKTDLHEAKWILS